MLYWVTLHTHCGLKQRKTSKTQQSHNNYRRNSESFKAKIEVLGLLGLSVPKDHFYIKIALLTESDSLSGEIARYMYKSLNRYKAFDLKGNDP